MHLPPAGSAPPTRRQNYSLYPARAWQRLDYTWPPATAGTWQLDYL